jgi:uncharacterized protein
MHLSLVEAQRIVIASQRLAGNASWKGKVGALRAIEHLGYVQIDTLAVVARAHHHTLWSRCAGYQEQFLEKLLKEKKVFEYWSHAASYLPMSEYRFSLTRKHIYANGKSHWFEQDRKMKKFVLDRIATEGPLQSKDFEQSYNTSSWYSWKPAKQALEQLFMEGKLMVAERRGFQKLYDLTERVLPAGIDITPPTEDESAQHIILKAIAANGIVTESEIGYLRGDAKKAIAKNIKHLLKEGIIVPLNISTFSTTYYGQRESIEKLLAEEMNSEVHILSPFDNVVIQRKRLQTLFEWDYIIECYLPESKRKFGYFCLPVLHGERFVARFDPKIDRLARISHTPSGNLHTPSIEIGSQIGEDSVCVTRPRLSESQDQSTERQLSSRECEKCGLEKTFIIKRFHVELDWKMTDAFAAAFAHKLRAFAAFNGCEKIVAGNDVPAVIRKALSAKENLAEVPV